MNYDEMPRDPFADDPNDPASFLDPDDDDFPPLTEEERQHVLQDLELVHRFRAALEPKGVAGITFVCEDCEEMHYYDWDIMATTMRATLSGAVAPVHEPSAQPNVDNYVSWDYCLGYLDGRANY